MVCASATKQHHHREESDGPHGLSMWETTKVRNWWKAVGQIQVQAGISRWYLRGMKKNSLWRASHRIRSLLHLAKPRRLPSCQQSSVDSQVEREADLSKANLPVGSPSDEGMVYLKANGFDCFPFAERSAIRGQPSFICFKTIVDRSWSRSRGIHTIQVYLDADEANMIASAKARIVWGGLRGL